jgi:hypothetical protein
MLDEKYKIEKVVTYTCPHGKHWYNEKITNPQGEWWYAWDTDEKEPCEECEKEEREKQRKAREELNFMFWLSRQDRGR